MRSVVMTLIFGLIWCGLYGLLQRCFHKRLSSHMVSLCHSLLAVLLIVAAKRAEGKGLLNADFDRSTLPHEEAILSVSLGYFLFDTVIMSLDRKTLPRSPMMLHHMGSCVALAEVLRSKVAGSAVLLVVFFLEGSNPLLHLRRILQHFKLDKGRLYIILELIYLAAFVYFRFIMAGKVTYDIFTGKTKCQSSHMYIAIFFNIVSIIFLGLIAIYASKKYFNKCQNIKVMR